MKKEYFGTYKLGNGCLFDVYIQNNKYLDVYNQEITKEELKSYTKII